MNALKFAGAAPAPKWGPSAPGMADPHGVWKKEFAFLDAARQNDLDHQKARNTLIYAQAFALNSQNQVGGRGGIYARRG